MHVLHFLIFNRHYEMNKEHISLQYRDRLIKEKEKLLEVSFMCTM